VPDPLVAGLPSPTAISYAAGMAQVTLDLVPSKTVTANVYSGLVPTSAVGTGTSQGSGIIVTISETLDPGTEYYVTLTFDPVNGPWGLPSVLVWQEVTLTKATVAGRGIDLQWSLPTTSTIATVRASLYDGNANVVATDVFQGAGGRLVSPVSMSATDVRTISLTIVNGVVSGPGSTTDPLVLASPTLTGVSYEAVQAGGYTVVASVTAPGGVMPAGASIVATLQRDGVVVQEQLATADRSATDGNRAQEQTVSTWTATFQLSSALDPGVDWRVAPFFRSGVVSGPPGAAVPLPMVAPRLTAAEYDGTNLSVRWEPAAGQTGSAGAYVEVRRKDDGSLVASQNDPAGFGTSFALGTIDATKSYTVSLAPVLGSARGAAGPATALVVARPVLTKVVSDGRTARVALTVSDSNATATTYELETSGGDVVFSWIGGLSGGFAPLPDLGADTLYVTARATNGSVTGPPATRAPLVLTSPSIAGVAFGGTAVTGTVVAPTLPPLDSSSMTVSLLADGVRSGAPVTAGQGGSFSVPTGSTARAGLSLRASVSGMSGTVMVSGPDSPPVPVLATGPTIVSAALAQTGPSAWTVSARWSPAPGETAGTYQVDLSQNGTVSKTWTVAGHSLDDAAPALDPTKVPSLTVTAVGNYGKGPASAPATFQIAATTAVSARLDGNAVTASWSPSSAQPAATSYRLRLVRQSGGTWATIARTEPASATTARIELPSTELGTSTYGVTVDAAVGDAWVATQTVTSLIVQRPQVTAAVVSATDGSLKIDWTSSTGAGAYDVSVASGAGAALHKTVTSNTLTLQAADLPGAGIYELKVTPLAAATANTVTGPGSVPARLVLEAPPRVTASWDGRNARVSWEPVPSSEVTGYAVSLLTGTTVVTSTTVATSPATIAAAFDATKTFDVVVQPLGSLGAGRASAPTSLFRPGWYASTSAAQPPHVVPVRSPAMETFDIVVNLPSIFPAPVTTGLPTAPFQMAPATAPPFAYTLTMGKDTSVWKFGDTDRAAVSTAYAGLLTALQALHVTASGWRTVQDAIARSMPQTFDETLRYAYGFDPTNGYVDLVPGMVLRADFESYQYLGPSTAPTGFVDGFVSSNTYEYEIASYVSSGDVWLTGFDAFLSAVADQGTTVPPPASGDTLSSGGGGIVDLYYPAFRAPFIRLVYPPSLLDASTSDARPAFNVALLAAADYTALNQATQNLRQAQPLIDGVAVTYLRGRTMLSACIRVWVDGLARTVPLGTTVGNVLETMGARPPILTQDAGSTTPPGLALSGIELTRATGAAVTDTTHPYDVASRSPIVLSWGGGMAYSGSTDWLSLPLLAGDRIDTKHRS
jgi:hypothetical protein